MIDSPPKSRTLRVFVSSTFRDMHAERDYLVRYVFPKLNEDFRDRNIHIDAVDLRWGVTSDDNANDVCLQLIDESRPLFLCMLGERYGWIPPGQSTSITAQEIEYATGGSERRCHYPFFYFRAAECIESIDDALRNNYIEAPDSPGTTLLSQLKTAIRAAEFPVRDYAAEWNTEKRQFEGLEDFGAMVYQDLYTAISEYYALQSINALSPLEYDTLLRESFIEEATRRYTVPYEDGVYNELMNFARNGAQDMQIITLAGRKGSGKTAMLAHLARSLPANNLIVLSYFPNASSDDPTLIDMLMELTFQLHDYSDGGIEDKKFPKNQYKLKKVFEAKLKAARQTRQVLILVDSIDKIPPVEIQPGHQETAYDTVRELLSHEKEENRTRAIISFNEEPTIRISWSSNPKIERYGIPALYPALRERIIQQYLGIYGKKLDATQMASLLAKQDTDYPEYLFAALNELRTLSTYELITPIIQELPTTRDDLFQWILERLENDPLLTRNRAGQSPRELVEHVLHWLALSRHGLSLQNLIGLQTEFTDTHDAQFQITALLQLIRPYVRVYDNIYALISDSLKDAIKRRYPKDKSMQLATYFLAHQDAGKPKRVQSETIHALYASEYLEVLFDYMLQLSKKLSTLKTGQGGIITYDELYVAKRSMEVIQNFQQPEPKWHPQPAESAGTTGPHMDYVDVYKYLCCNEHCLSEGNPPPQFINHGCKPRPAGGQDLATFNTLKQNTLEQWTMPNGVMDYIVNALDRVETKSSLDTSTQSN